MRVGHAETLDRFSPEIELNHDSWFAADHPSVMAGLYGNRLGSFEFHYTSVPILDMNLAVGEKSDVRVLAQIATD